MMVWYMQLQLCLGRCNEQRQNSLCTLQCSYHTENHKLQSHLDFLNIFTTCGKQSKKSEGICCFIQKRVIVTSDASSNELQSECDAITQRTIGPFTLIFEVFLNEFFFLLNMIMDNVQIIMSCEFWFFFFSPEINNIIAHINYAMCLSISGNPT